MTACNPDRFTERVMADYGVERAYCRCCGRRIAINDEFMVTRDTNDLDGYCRWCELGHPKRVKVEQAPLFGKTRACVPSSRVSDKGNG